MDLLHCGVVIPIQETVERALIHAESIAGSGLKGYIETSKKQTVRCHDYH